MGRTSGNPRIEALEKKKYAELPCSTCEIFSRVRYDDMLEVTLVFCAINAGCEDKRVPSEVLYREAKACPGSELRMLWLNAPSHYAKTKPDP
ncbi:MAG: hypothetical protein ABA06_00290 [Parcubacteria bacterium C7867-001]|nr:MAG: hypothetical protein ABA06_00290 [Parcubacteria bacterium C7867-001]